MTSGMEQRAAETPPAQQSRPEQRQQQPPPPPWQQEPQQHAQPAGATVACSTAPRSDVWSTPEFFTDWGDFDPHLVL